MVYISTRYILFWEITLSMQRPYTDWHFAKVLYISRPLSGNNRHLVHVTQNNICRQMTSYGWEMVSRGQCAWRVNKLSVCLCAVVTSIKDKWNCVTCWMIRYIFSIWNLSDLDTESFSGVNVWLTKYILWCLLIMRFWMKISESVMLSFFC